MANGISFGVKSRYGYSDGHSIAQCAILVDGEVVGELRVTEGVDGAAYRTEVRGVGFKLPNISTLSMDDAQSVIRTAYANSVAG